MKRISSIWLEILSEVFVNLGSGWFGLVFYEAQFTADPVVLFLRIVFGSISLMIAKLLREEARKR